MAGCHHQLDGHEFEWTLGVDVQQAWHAAIHGVTKSRTWLSDWTELNWSSTNLAALIMCFRVINFIFLINDGFCISSFSEHSQPLAAWMCFYVVVFTVSSVQFSCSVVSDSLRPRESQHARPPCPSPTPRVHSDSRLSSQWCHPAISSSVIPFSSYPQSLLASESFPMSQLFTWGGQSTAVSASAPVPPKKSQCWFPSEWTGWISLQSKGLSRVFSNTTVQKHQFFGAQLSSQSNSHINTWPLEKP